LANDLMFHVEQMTCWPVNGRCQYRDGSNKFSPYRIRTAKVTTLHFYVTIINATLISAIFQLALISASRYLTILGVMPPALISVTALFRNAIRSGSGQFSRSRQFCNTPSAPVLTITATDPPAVDT
jgi:hypothetical protein